MKDGCVAAKTIGPSFLLMDRYFLSRDSLRVLEREGQQQVTLITKAKKSAVAYEKPNALTGKRGRPRLTGKKLVLRTLFQSRNDQFKETTVTIYGKSQPVTYYMVNALWGQGLYQELRFVLVVHNGIESILVSTDLTLSAETIVTLYSYRFKIETTFRAFKQTIAGFSYHFWSKSLSKLNRTAKKTDVTPLEKITDEADKQAIIKTFDACERFVQLAFIAQGLVQLVALSFPKELLDARWLRTSRDLIPSEATVVHYFQQSFFWQSLKTPPIGILQLIKSKQLSFSEENDESSTENCG